MEPGLVKSSISPNCVSVSVGEKHETCGDALGGRGFRLTELGDGIEDVCARKSENERTEMLASEGCLDLVEKERSLPFPLCELACEEERVAVVTDIDGRVEGCVLQSQLMGKDVGALTPTSWEDRRCGRGVWRRRVNGRTSRCRRYSRRSTSGPGILGARVYPEGEVIMVAITHTRSCHVIRREMKYWKRETDQLSKEALRTETSSFGLPPGLRLARGQENTDEWWHLAAAGTSKIPARSQREPCNSRHANS